MRTFNSVTIHPCFGIAGLMMVLAFCGIIAGCTTDSGTAAAKSGSTNPKSPYAEISLSGAELYTVNCNRCHAERYPTEWNSGEWATVLTHMRVRANLTAPEARAILKYLQDNSGN